MDQRIIDGIKDFRLFAEAFLRINVKNASNDNSTSPFILNRAQLFTHAKLEAQKAKLGRVRALILKGRQQGLSTMVQGRNFHNIITTTGKIAFIMAHEGDATDNLFKITRRFYDNLPAGLCPPASKLNTTEMEFDCFQSAYRVGTAGNKKTGRGQTIHLFHGCLSADSLIVLADGSTKSMCEIMPGDMVLTSSGAHASVSNKIYTGEKLTYTLDCWLSGEPIHITSDHKMLTLDGYKELKDITVSDFIAMPKIELSNEIKTYSFSLKNKERPQGGGSKHIEEFTFDLTYNFGYLLGYYLAEGHIKENLSYISFAYHKDETYINNALKGTFGLETSFRHKLDIGTLRKRTVLNGKFLASALNDICGRVNTKHIPAWFFQTNKDFLSGVFKGYLDGDGSKTQIDKIAAPSIHEKISRQLQRISWSLYGSCSVRRKSRMRYDILTKDIFLFSMSGDSMRRYLGIEPNHRLEKSIIKDGVIYSKVRSITERKIEPVWDIEVNHPDHNYQTTSGIVSNSEVAFWENTDDLTTGILQAIPDAPGTESILESTANGTGNFFHSLWLDAESGKSDYIPIFIPWYWQDEYRASAEGMICDQDELEILEQHAKNGLTLEHLSWRRIKLGNLNRDDERARDMFKQEYPFTSAEAFLNPVKDSFIKPRFVNKARNTKVETDMGLIIGVDPADDKDGSDRTAIIFRRGRRAYGLKTYRNHNTMQLAGVLVQMIKQHNPAKVYIDCIGIGKGTVDRLQELGYECVVGLNVATNAHNREIYANRRAELWDEMREWFIQDMGVEIPDSDELQTDLVSVWAKYRSNGQLVMSSKDEMKKLGLPSPDTADCLMHTFAGGFHESSINRTVERMPDHHRSMFT